MAAPGTTAPVASTNAKAVYRLDSNGSVALYATWVTGGTGSIRAVAAPNSSGKVFWTGSSGLYFADPWDTVGTSAEHRVPSSSVTNGYLNVAYSPNGVYVAAGAAGSMLEYPICELPPHTYA